MSHPQTENFNQHQLEIQAENIAKELGIPIQIIHYCWVNNCGDEATIKDDNGEFVCSEHASKYAGEFSQDDKQADKEEADEYAAQADENSREV